eukprot:scaffold73168_cov30-Tisochrysis_lutea.AAC.1
MAPARPRDATQCNGARETIRTPRLGGSGQKESELRKSELGNSNSNASFALATQSIAAILSQGSGSAGKVGLGN